MQLPKIGMGTFGSDRYSADKKGRGAKPRPNVFLSDHARLFAALTAASTMLPTLSP